MLIKDLCVACVIIATIAGGCSAINRRLGLQDDHALEEHLEDKIEDHTGLDIDLSHESPED